MFKMESQVGDATPEKHIESGVHEEFLSDAEQAIQCARKEYAEKKELSPEILESIKRESAYCLQTLIQQLDQKQITIAAQLLAKMYVLPGNLIDREMIDLYMKYRLSEISLHSRGVLEEKMTLVAKEILKYYQLDPEKVTAAWSEAISPIGTSTENFNPFIGFGPIFENVERIRSLELARPNSASFLSKEFGIMNFGDYPLEMLIDQYDGAEDLDHPYGVIVTGRRDYNYSNSDDSRKDVLRSLFNQLRGKYRIRLLESGGKLNLSRSLINLDRRYGARQKISFAMISGHGTKDMLALGDWSKGKPITNIYSNDLVAGGKILIKIRDFFTEHATIILDSCSSGEKRGLAQNIFKRLGIDVIGFDKKSAGISSISTKDKGDRLDFKIKFKVPSLLFGYRPRRARRYS